MSKKLNGKAKAKARKMKQQVQTKQLPKGAFNETQVLDALKEVADIVEKQYPNQGYTDTHGHLMNTAKILLNNADDKGNKLIDGNFNQMLKFRDKFEQALEKKWGCEFSHGLSAFMQDMGAMYEHKGVPKNAQIVSGLLDCICTIMGIKNGAIAFHNAA